MATPIGCSAHSPSARSLTARVKERARELGFDLVGIAPAEEAPFAAALTDWLVHGYHGEMAYLMRTRDARQDTRQVDVQARSLIVVGVRYAAPRLPAELCADPSRGRIAAYAWGLDYHDAIRSRLFALDAFLRQESGRTTLARCYVDSGPVLERAWAMRAGLGFIGRNTCLIHPQLGSWLFLGALLAPEELDPDPAPIPLALPAHSSAPAWRHAEGALMTCGACTRCLEACPTQAFVDAYTLDARRCISYLTIELKGPIPRALRPRLGNWIFGCDVCQEVCPWSRRQARAEEGGEIDLEQWAPRLLDLLALDEEAFRRRFRKTALWRAKRRGLLRNVCVAIGNWGDPAALAALATALHDAEPLIRGHAAWALGRIGGTRAGALLERALASEADPYVRDELQQARQEMAGGSGT